MKRLTLEQKTATVTAIQELINQGVTQKAACKEWATSPSSFLKWSRLKTPKIRKPSTKLTVTDLPDTGTDNGQLFMICGGAQQLRQFMREMQ